MSDDDSDRPKRRSVLKKTGAAVAAGSIFPGAAAANPGRGNPGEQGGPGENGRGENGKGGNGPGGDGPGGGPPFEDPETDNVVFCGCSQVCICSADCCSVYVYVKGADNIVVDGEVPTCVEVEEGQIVAVADTGFDSDDNPAYEGKPGLYCNPNTACGGFSSLEWPNGDEEPMELTSDDCTKYGTAPQFGARCGEAFLKDCPGCDS